MNLDELLTASIAVDEEVLAYFASAFFPWDYELDDVADDGGHPIYALLTRQLAAVGVACVDLVLQDRKFIFFHGKESAAERSHSARIWALKAALRYQIPARRLARLQDQKPGEEAPAPLDHPALAGIAVSKDLLVPLSEFDLATGILIRGGFAFTALAPVEASNSQYWFLSKLCSPELRKAAWVRLDPLLVRAAAGVSVMHYKVWNYGRPLDWSRLRSSRDEDFGQWVPGQFAPGFGLTEFAWTPRDGQIHFRCEELPDAGSLVRRGSRYLHAIYDPSTDDVIHLDAAVRVYDADSWRQRKYQHVRNAGKIGSRHKVFRVEGRINVDQFCDLAASFFMWNSDVQRYFGADIPEGL